ncbi:MAG: pectin acetylesterase-family hydrolase [Anaeromyxobacteraceae bacterium]
MRPAPLASLLLPGLLLASGCGPAGGAERFPLHRFTWLPVEGSVCGDGSPTGVAVSRGEGDGLLVFLDGGGACWDALTCFGAGATLPALVSRGPFGAAQADARLRDVPGSILDRDLPGNPFARFTLVFVPYCTGDVHAGDASQDYPGAPGRMQHRGRANVRRAVAALRPLFSSPAGVVLAGASAGGYGALVNHPAVRDAWPSASGTLVDDSGPPLVGSDLSPAIVASWVLAWRLDEAVTPICGEGCLLDLSGILPALSRRYPADRLALLSSTQDEVIRGYTLLGPAGFERALDRLVRDVIAPLPNAAAFRVEGSRHTMLGHPADFTEGGVPLLEWLGRATGRSPGWASEGP